MTTILEQIRGSTVGANGAMRECVERCNDAHAAVLATVEHCLGKGGRHAEQGHVRLLLDAADVTRTSADLMLRGSGHHGVVCGACAEICEAAAEDNESFEGDDIMKACADALRRCADSCRQMADHAA